MVNCRVESIFKNTYFMCRELETNMQGIITWSNYSKSFYNLKKEMYLGKIINAEVLGESNSGILKLSRVAAIKEKKKEKVDFYKNSLLLNNFQELYKDELYGRHIYRDLSKLIPFAEDLLVSNALVVGYDNNNIYLELDELDILGVIPIGYLGWHRIKDKSKLKSFIGVTIDVKLVGFGDVNLFDTGGSVHKKKDSFICSSALVKVPDYDKLICLEGTEVMANVVASNSTGSILRSGAIPLDLYLKESRRVGSTINCKIKSINVKKNIIEVELV